MQRLFTQREKTIFYLTVGIVAFSILFNFFIAPVMNKNEDLNRQINVNRSKLKRYLKLLSQKEYIQNKYKELSTTFKISDKREDRLVEVLSDLESLAKSANIRIVDVRPQGGLSGNTREYKEILVDLRAEGTMPDYLKFIYNLEHSLSLLRIKRLQLSSKPNSQALESIFSISQLSVSE